MMTASSPLTASEGPDLLSLNALLVPLIKHRKLLLVVFIVSTGIGAAGSYLISPVFRSTVSLLPPQQQQSGAAAALSSLGSLQAVTGGAFGIKTPADQYASLLQSVTVADRLVDRFGLLQAFDVKLRQDARAELAERTRVTIGKKDGMLSIAVEDTDPSRAASIANAYVDELRKLTQGLALSEAQQRRAFFGKQLEDSTLRLTKAQTDLQRSGLNAGALKAEPRLAAEDYAKLRAELASSEIKLRALRVSFAEGSPEVQRQSATIAELRARVSALEINQLANSNPSSSDYISKFRAFKYEESLFEMLAKQYEAARVDEAREGALIQVVDAAMPAERKSKPRRAAIALGSGVAMTLLAALVLVLRGRRIADRPPTPST